jgi:hypothetical protein
LLRGPTGSQHDHQASISRRILRVRDQESQRLRRFTSR